MKLPDGWREVALGDIVESIQPGFAQRPGKEDDEGTLPQIRTHNITPEGRISLEGIKYVSAVGHDAGRFTLQQGDVVFNNTNSEEWVGKTALFGQGTLVYSNHVTRIRVLRPLVVPEYLARYLHFLWAIGHSRNRAKRWVSQAAVDGPTLLAYRVPLPSLQEQEAILEILREAEGNPDSADRRLHLLDGVQARVIKLLIESVDPKEWVPLGQLVTTRYGTSSPADEGVAEGRTPILRIPNVLDGEVNVEDLKYIELEAAERERLSLETTDVLVVRSNGNPDYVGRSASVTARERTFVFASYLIRLRAEPSRLLPEYLSGFLNSKVGRISLRNAIRTTAGQSNLSSEALCNVRIAVPALPRQEHFGEIWARCRSLRRSVGASREARRRLFRSLAAAAFSGRLTATWRQREMLDALTNAARDGGRVTPESVSAYLGKVLDAVAPLAPDRQRRSAIVQALSDFQREVWDTLRFEWGRVLVADDPGVLADFCGSPQSSWRLSGFDASLAEVRSALEQLAAVGLVAKVTLPRDDEQTGRREYPTAFRPLRAGEDRALADAADVARLMASESG